MEKNSFLFVIFVEHVAIMRKSWRLTRKILSGEKKIESRWYCSRCAPWNRINAGEIVYFKDSGEPVAIKAEVEKVLHVSDLTQEKVKNILEKYGDEDGIEKEDIPKFFQLFKNKKYCLLIFLKNPQRIEPFQISKKGFGTMSAWISVPEICKIKI